jgi:hypothetical protein
MVRLASEFGLTPITRARPALSPLAQLKKQIRWARLRRLTVGRVRSGQMRLIHQKFCSISWNTTIISDVVPVEEQSIG